MNAFLFLLQCLTVQVPWTTPPWYSISTNGGTRSFLLCPEVVHLWEGCIHCYIMSVALHLPGLQNTMTDHLNKTSLRTTGGPSRILSEAGTAICGHVYNVQEQDVLGLLLQRGRVGSGSLMGMFHLQWTLGLFYAFLPIQSSEESQKNSWALFSWQFWHGPGSSGSLNW